MPRTARQDALGDFQHVMARGIERRAIFLDDDDRARFLARLARILADTGTLCFAFALMSNHYHLLLQSRATALCRVMLRFGTGYAMDFNRRHGRVGHLFQNRFKSRIAEDEALARREMARFLRQGLSEDDPGEAFDGAAGRLPAEAPEAASVPVPEDGLDAAIERRLLRVAGWDLERVVAAVCAHRGVDPGMLRSGRRCAPVARARVAITGLAVEILGETHAAVARATGVSPCATTQALARFGRWPADTRTELRGLLPDVLAPARRAAAPKSFLLS